MTKQKHALVIFIFLLFFKNSFSQFNDREFENSNHKTIQELRIQKIPFENLTDISNVMDLNVMEYFKTYINSNYTTKLQVDLFKRGNEYIKLVDSLKAMKNLLIGNYFMAKTKSEQTYDYSNYIFDIEAYNIDRKLKTVAISLSDNVIGGKVEKDNLFGAYYFPEIIYSKNTRISEPYQIHIKLIEFPLSIEEAIRYDHKKIEAYVLYKFEGLNSNSEISSSKTKLLITYKDSVIFEKNFIKNNFEPTTKPPFVGTKTIFDPSNNSTYYFKLDKLGALSISMESRNGKESLYKGKYSEIIKTKYYNFRISQNEIAFLDKLNKILCNCVDLESEDLNEKPCVYDISNGKLK